MLKWLYAWYEYFLDHATKTEYVGMYVLMTVLGLGIGAVTAKWTGVW